MAPNERGLYGENGRKSGTFKGAGRGLHARLKQEYPLAHCTLDYSQAWQLLVEVRLAASAPTNG